MNDMTDEEIREELKLLHEQFTDIRLRIQELIEEILSRKRNEVHDGYWTAYGFVPKDQ